MCKRAGLARAMYGKLELRLLQLNPRDRRECLCGLGAFCPILSASLATAVSAGMEGEQSPFPARTVLAGTALLCAGPVKRAHTPLREKGAPASQERADCICQPSVVRGLGWTPPRLHGVPVGNLTNDSACELACVTSASWHGAGGLPGHQGLAPSSCFCLQWLEVDTSV